MKKVLVLCVCFAVALVLGTSDARAAGFGIYGSAGGDEVCDDGRMTAIHAQYQF